MSARTGFHLPEELESLGLASWGDDVLISRRASVYGASRVHVGDHVRIDDFAVITAGPDERVRIGSHVHIAAHSALYGGGGITLDDFVTVSGRTSIYSVTDDYGGEVMTNPTVPHEYTRVVRRRVRVGRHVVIGAGCVVMPGVTIGEGSAIGAMTFVPHSLEPWGVYIGVPARLLRARSRLLLSLEEALVAEEARRAQPPGK